MAKDGDGERAEDRVVEANGERWQSMATVPAVIAPTRLLLVQLARPGSGCARSATESVRSAWLRYMLQPANA
jgi:hypothetical protein